MNNKLLIGLLLVLLAAWGISKFMSDGEGTFDPEIISVDSASVDKIVLHAKADGFEKTIIQKNSAGWEISKNGKTYQALNESVAQLLGEMGSVKTSQIAAKSPDKWAQYELGDDQATCVAAYSGENIQADFFIGKFKFNPQAQNQPPIFYFRLADQPEIYAVLGMAGMTLGQGSSAYRNKQIMQMKDPGITEVNLAGDVGYHIQKMPDGQWLLDGDAVMDSSQVKKYLINLRSMSGETFVDDFDPNMANDRLLKTLTLKGDNLPGDVVVRCWKDEANEKPFTINSNLFPDSYFASDSTRLFTRLFKPIWEW